MKKTIIMLLALMFVMSACTKKNADTVLTAGPETTLNVAVNYLDNIFINTQVSLELIAQTPEAESGDWSGIKSYLKQLETELPGVYFYVMPDGNYYSLTRDYTNLNLSDRAYFKPLFDGDPVIGYPLYSRSSGKKSALMAVPIVRDNKVIGGLGCSVFLDDLHAKLNDDLGLPSSYAWYVVDSKGNTVLDKDFDLIFMNTLTQEGESLEKAMTEALKNKSGSMAYEFGGSWSAHYKKVPYMNWWMVLAKNESKEVETPAQLMLSLDRFVPDLQKSLNQIDMTLENAIKEIAPDYTKESEIRELLTAIITNNQDVVEANFVTLNGILRYVEPSDYKNFENADISMQDHVIALRKYHEPEFSSGFMAVEGFLAVDMAYPIYDENKKLFGSVSVLIRPELLINPLLKKSEIPEDYELWIMQMDGMIIYDQDPEEIGRMLFSDPLYAKYESLLELGKTIVAEAEGTGSYVFLAPGSTEKTIKNVIWQTVQKFEREWRVVLAYSPY